MTLKTRRKSIDDSVIGNPMYRVNLMRAPFIEISWCKPCIDWRVIDKIILYRYLKHYSVGVLGCLVLLLLFFFGGVLFLIWEGVGVNVMSR